MTDLISALLARRVRRNGADPLITYYDLDSGERTELSAVSFANWVNKTSNLLVDELLVDPGDAVQLTLAETHPGHWVTLIWELACWQVGAVVSLDPAVDAKVIVVGPGAGWTTFGRHRGRLLLAASARAAVRCEEPGHRLQPRGPRPGRPVSGRPAVGVRSGLAQPRPRSRSERSAGRSTASSSRRRMIVPSDPWRTAQDALITPLVTGGSTVIVSGAATDAQLDRIRTTERAT